MISIQSAMKTPGISLMGNCKAPETGEPVAVPQDQNQQEVIVNNVAQFQAIVQQEVQRVSQTWPRGWDGFNGIIHVTLGPADPTGDRRIVSVRLILALRTDNAHDCYLPPPPCDFINRPWTCPPISIDDEYQDFQPRARRLLSQEVTVLAHPEQFIFQGIDANRLVINFVVGPIFRPTCTRW